MFISLSLSLSLSRPSPPPPPNSFFFFPFLLSPLFSVSPSLWVKWWWWLWLILVVAMGFVGLAEFSGGGWFSMRVSWILAMVVVEYVGGWVRVWVSWILVMLMMVVVINFECGCGFRGDGLWFVCLFFLWWVVVASGYG